MALGTRSRQHTDQIVLPPAKRRKGSTSASTPATTNDEAKGPLLMQDIDTDLTRQHLAFQASCTRRHCRFYRLHVGVDISMHDVVGKLVHVYWPAEDDWFLATVASYDAHTMQHLVEYHDGDTEQLFLPLELVRVQLGACENIDRPSLEHVTALFQALPKAIRVLPATERKMALQRCKDVAMPSNTTTPSWLPGDVVWATFSKGCPPWPALVVTPGDVMHANDTTQSCHMDGGSKGRGSNSIPVQFFGSYECVCVSSVTSMQEGLGRGYHMRIGVKYAAAFGASLYQLRCYLKDGRLPDAMRPVCADVEEEEEEDDDAGQTLSHDDHAALELPSIDPTQRVDISKNLAVLHWGDIEKHHPSFHDKHWIYPVDYVAMRSMASPASSHKPKQHLLHIAFTTKGPLFRILLLRKSPHAPKLVAYGTSANLAMSSLMGRTVTDGRAVFGLTARQVKEHIQTLEGVEYCVAYEDWVGKRPPAPPEGLALRRARLCAATTMQTLPPGVQPITIPRICTEGVCDVCGEDAEYDGNHLLQCDKCGCMVHTECYSVQHRPDGRLWLCDVCRLGLETPPPCALCPVVGGIMKPTACGHWVHCACALWVPETCPVSGDAEVQAREDVGINGMVTGLEQVPKARRNLICSVCNQQYGACIQCAGHRKCRVAFHPLCARGAGLAMEWVEEEGWSSNGAHAGEGKGSSCSPHVVSPGRSGLSKAVKKQRAAASKLHTTPPLRKKSNAQGGGTCTADGIRMLCYCPKHQPATAQPMPCTIQQPAVDKQVETHPAECARVMDAAARAAVRRVGPGVPYIMGGRAKGPLPVSRVVDPGAPGHVAPKVLSISDRYHIMRNTAHTRLAFGRSGIHGYGLFTRTAHSAGTLLIEYAGEVVRPPVVELRERRLYNTIVGAGTYVFGLGDQHAIDATTKGSQAHLINHSCQANCYSRTISVLHQPEGVLREHVVICARRDLHPGEELSYDYRFRSTEVLACTCGAAGCRGTVNCPDEQVFLDDTELAPRDEIKHVSLQHAQHMMA